MGYNLYHSNQVYPDNYDMNDNPFYRLLYQYISFIGILTNTP